VASVVTPQVSFWAGRSVLVTGHTGFKGAWLSLWLAEMGAEVHGFSLDPTEGQTVFHAADVASSLASDARADLRDQSAVEVALETAAPEIVFHLAAQPLVSAGYQSPSVTWMTNVQGSVHLLESVRRQPSVCAVVVVTTDKVYEDLGQGAAHSESDRLGGHDPYSSSKAAVELLVDSYRKSFWNSVGGTDVRLATARAGNVIGGGDWGVDRLVPDCLRAFEDRRPALLRSPGSVRPWQHVLEPLCGYLLVAERLTGDTGHDVATSWNFGPDASGEATVEEVARMVAVRWGHDAEILEDPCSHQIHETEILRLDSTKAKNLLGWSPRWGLEEAVSRTVDWHIGLSDGMDLQDLCVSQIADYLGVS
jgi:CDP-glucose 4,6-dehydratase